MPMEGAADPSEVERFGPIGPPVDCPRPRSRRQTGGLCSGEGSCAAPGSWRSQGDGSFRARRAPITGSWPEAPEGAMAGWEMKAITAEAHRLVAWAAQVLSQFGERLRGA